MTEHGHPVDENHSKPLHTRLTEALKHPFSSHRSRKSSDSEQGGISQGALDKRQEKADKAERLEKEEEERLQKREEADRAAREEETEDERNRWGEGDMRDGELTTLDELASEKSERSGRFTVRGRIVHQRKTSPTLIFLLIRDTTHTIQCVLKQGDGVPEHMIKWASQVSVESLVQISGTLHRPPSPISSASISNLELHIESLHTLSPAHSVNYDNYRPPEQMQQRLAHRILDLRHPANHALFRIRAAIIRVWRNELDKRDFLEIQTPKLQPAATESGAEVFKVNYFGRKAFLAQSPQLAKQMAISSDMKRVYEVGPVFRAENSNTHRHLAEYTGLDLEMEIRESYSELMDLLITVLVAIIKQVQSMPELAVVRERFPSDDFLLPDQVPIIPFTQGLQMLRDDGREVAEEDLSTPDEIRLGELVRAKYHSDLYVLDKFPANARPFYTHLDPSDPKWTNSFDMFFRGQEICTGGQRVTDPAELREKMKTAGVMDGMDEYLAAFDAGVAPHGGAGLGLERIVFLLLNLGDVRYATLFHRDPKSLPEKPPALPHPEADTTRPRTGKEAPSLEALIHNYGDASNTGWLDADRWTIWRHYNGAAVAYSPQKGRLAMMIGDPLCDRSQFPEVIAAFLAEMKEQDLTPIWMLVSEGVQEVLARQHNMRTFTCAEEQRLDVDENPPEVDQQAVRRAERDGVKVHEVTLDEGFISRANREIERWTEERKHKGKQMYMTEVRPFVDQAHRRYFAAEKDDQIFSLVVLAQLSPAHGHQVKWALDFPGAPSGVIDVTVGKALEAITGPVTFGAGASESLQPGFRMHGARAKMMSRTYASIASTMGLRKKTGFREKFGAQGESVYICYPKNGLSVRDMREMVAFFED